MHVAPWNVVHACGTCEDGWVCENHPDQPWPSGCDCGAGMPCPRLLTETDAAERLGHWNTIEAEEH